MNKINIFRIFLMPALFLSLQSCFVARDYSRPELINDVQYRTDNISTDSITLANVSWKEMFTDPVLVSYIEEGLENNIDIRIAIQQINASQAYMKQARAGYLPAINLGGGVNHQILSPNSQFGSFFDGSITQYEATGNLSWEADIWGRIASNDRASQANYLQTVAAHQAVKTELIAGIASMYYQLLALDEQVRITQETLRTRESGLETTKALKEAGVVTEVGVKQTEAQMYRVEAVLIELENNVRLVENAFSILLGDSPRNIDRGSLSDQEITTELRIGVPAQLLRNRPDVIAAEYNLMNAFELTNVARASFYPSLSLNATGGLQSLDLSELFNVNSLFANLAASVAQPVFNRRQIKTQYEVSQAQQEIALLNFRRALITASREVSDALNNYETALARIEIKNNEFEAYELATTYSEELLTNGMANYLEVLTARENTLNSQLELVNSRLNELNSVIDLYQALGGGWQ